MNDRSKTLPSLVSTEGVIAGADKQRQWSRARRGPGRPFEKGNRYAWQSGQSGNYAGRPKARTLSEAYRTALAQTDESDPQRRTFAELIAERLVRVAAGLTSEPSTNAAREISDRTEGRPRQTIELDPIVEASQLLASLLGISVDQLPRRDVGGKILNGGDITKVPS